MSSRVKPPRKNRNTTKRIPLDTAAALRHDVARSAVGSAQLFQNVSEAGPDAGVGSVTARQQLRHKGQGTGQAQFETRASLQLPQEAAQHGAFAEVAHLPEQVGRAQFRELPQNDPVAPNLRRREGRRVGSVGWSARGEQWAA